MQFEILSDIGKKRTVNEDSAAVFTLPEGITLAVIADGMGATVVVISRVQLRLKLSGKNL